MNSRAWRYGEDDLPSLNPFGSVLVEQISVANFDGDRWSDPELLPLNDFRLHPGSHCLHYGSSCFEGLKAYRWADDSLVIFRPERHAERLAASARTLCLPEPPTDLFMKMVQALVAESAEYVPAAPGSLYLRPVLIGTDPNIGAAAKPSSTACLYVLASPVGNYFAAGDRALRLMVEDQLPRTTPQFGSVKTGANYATALGNTLRGKEKYQADQILFCPDGDVQETGAANFILIDDDSVTTKPLASSFLHGITRDSILTIASDLGYTVNERDFSVPELLQRCPAGEAALSGTAAVLASVGTLIYGEQEYVVGDGLPGKNTQRLRSALMDIQQGKATDRHHWISKVS